MRRMHCLCVKAPSFVYRRFQRWQCDPRLCRHCERSLTVSGRSWTRGGAMNLLTYLRIRHSKDRATRKIRRISCKNTKGVNRFALKDLQPNHKDFALFVVVPHKDVTMRPEDAVAFIESHGVVLESANLFQIWPIRWPAKPL